MTAFNLVQFFDTLDSAFDEVADTSSKNTARDPVPISALNQRHCMTLPRKKLLSVSAQVQGRFIFMRRMRKNLSNRCTGIATVASQPISSSAGGGSK